MMTHAIKQNREFFILQIIQLKNLIFKSMNNLLINLLIYKTIKKILITSILKIIKFYILIIKFLRDQNELTQEKSCLTFKKMKKNLWKPMNLKSMTCGLKTFKL